MALSDTEICNLALAELPDKAIASLDEASLQGRECKRVYQQAVEELLQPHPWSFPTTRITLAEIANDRPGEWAHAYQMPTGVGMVRKIIWPQPDTTGLTAPVLFGQRLAPPGGGQTLWDRAPPQDYVTAGTTIYTDVPGAVLEYLLSTDGEATFSPLFIKALYFDIASRICMPLTKSSDRKKELISQAELWKGRATAADLNSQRQTYDPVPDALSAYS